VIDAERLADAVAAGPLPRKPYVAALPMYDWPERRHEVDAEWWAVRDALRARGIDAPEQLTRRNADLPGYSDDSPDELDLPKLWQHPNLLLAQTCHGPLELWLKDVRIVGQEDYSGIEGGEGVLYSSAIVMRKDRNFGDSLLNSVKEAGPVPLRSGDLSKLCLKFSSRRFAYNAPDSVSGYLALKRDLEAIGSGLHLFAELIETRGHRGSIRAVADGRADVASIDCKSWSLAQSHDIASRDLDVVGWTAFRTGLPFVTRAARR
jgi:ABC-type phosphate/phosphonate transport system substrate-binding protein